MNLFDATDYNRRARLYWWTVSSLGAIAIGFSARSIIGMDPTSLAELLLLIGVVLITGLFQIRIPGTQTTITPADVFIFLSLLSLGPAAATLVAATDAFAGSLRASRRLTSRLGGPAIMAIAMFASGNLFQLSVNWLVRAGLYSTATLLLALLVFSIVHFALNTLTMSALSALKQGVPLFRSWWRTFSWISLTCMTSATGAGLIYLGMERNGISAVLAAGPLVVMTSATCRYYFKQADERAKAGERISRLHLATVEALATAINAKDEITNDHVYRVQVYARGLAQHFNLSSEQTEALKAGALLHDVGKIAVPDYILNKPGRLTAAEFEKMKMHTIVGAEILERVNFPYPVVPIVRHHHERWDGYGYPDGLRGNEIPITARILSVVDCFDAVREDRQYRKAITRVEACALLQNGSGTQFDPSVVDAFLQHLESYEAQIAQGKASGYPKLGMSMQAGLSESALLATPAAGLATGPEVPGYLRQINAAHVEVAALYELAQSFTVHHSVREVAELTVRQLERVIGFTTCVFYLCRESDDSLVAEYAFGENADQIRGQRLAPGRGIAGWVAINDQPMTNVDPMLDLSHFCNTSTTRYQACVVYPLAGVEQTLGAVAIYASDRAEYTKEQIQLFESFTRLASTAFQNAFYYEKTQASVHRDPLTGLPNARVLYDFLGERIKESDDRGTQLTIIAFALSDVAAINDEFGYASGDRLIAETGRFLQSVVGEQCLLSRIAGANFIGVFTNYSRSFVTGIGERSRSEAQAVNLELRPGRVTHLPLFYGVADYQGSNQSLDDLLRTAVAAASRDKSSRCSERSSWIALTSSPDTPYSN